MIGKTNKFKAISKESMPMTFINTQLVTTKDNTFTMVSQIAHVVEMVCGFAMPLIFNYNTMQWQTKISFNTLE
jgi:hypothetical protein